MICAARRLPLTPLPTGYSLVLRKMLQLGGLKEGDYALESVGATATRAQALMENKFAGTILTTPLEIAPESRGYRRLANAGRCPRTVPDDRRNGAAQLGKGPIAMRSCASIRASTRSHRLVVRSEEPRRGRADLPQASAKRARGRRATARQRAARRA